MRIERKGSLAMDSSDQVMQSEEPVFVGDEFPKWVKDGARVRIKRVQGITCGRGATGLFCASPGYSYAKSSHRLWSGDVGTIRRRDGNGWWDYEVEFDLHGRTKILDKDFLGYLVRVKQ